MLCSHQLSYLLRMDGLITFPLSSLEVSTGAPCFMCKVICLLGFTWLSVLCFLKHLRRVHCNTTRFAILFHTMFECLWGETILLVVRCLRIVLFVFLKHRVKIDRNTINPLLPKEYTCKAKEGFSKRLCKCTLLHILLLSVYFFIISHNKLDSQCVNHNDLRTSDTAHLLY